MHLVLVRCFNCVSFRAAGISEAFPNVSQHQFTHIIKNILIFFFHSFTDSPEPVLRTSSHAEHSKLCKYCIFHEEVREMMLVQPLFSQHGQNQITKVGPFKCHRNRKNENSKVNRRILLPRRKPCHQSFLSFFQPFAKYKFSNL